MLTSSWLLFLFLGLSLAWMEERPVLESNDGNLCISSAKDRNITLKTVGSGYINVNGINLLHVAESAHNATKLIDRWRIRYLAEIETNIQRLTDMVEGPAGLQRRLALLEDGGNATTGRPSGRPRDTTVTDQVVRNGLRRLNDKVRRLEDRVTGILSKLRENDCQSNPCQNGGTCMDMYESYQCYCVSGWEGPNCMTDINECSRFLGTDLGCQNGATCYNLPGTYRCDCPPNWYGLHCTQKTAICSTRSSEELCGHGVCVDKPGSSLQYTCICDQGWETDGTNPACTKDVDECAAPHPPCSVSPPVPCRNTLGSFTCGSCPRGYTGNGYYCADIDECQVDNGGCSTTPYVKCVNTIGSRICGPCPLGYHGDGVTCVYVGRCNVNNGGCHSLATCTENPNIPGSFVQCRCPLGYHGDGMGPNGCQPGAVLPVTLSPACHDNPCYHGTCVPGGPSGFTCRCDAGYTGALCNAQIDPCNPNPCKNNGACIATSEGATCDCKPAYTGNRCETAKPICGGANRNPVGHFEFPGSGSIYQHSLSCAWILITNHSRVLNVTFTAFKLEHSTDCKYDFLQIHDGRNAGSHMIGRYCGESLPNGGNIISSHDALYFWFHSDSTVAHDGFAFHWNTIEPICGGTLTEDFGTITSPGSPGRYPPDRDCYWFIYVRPGKRVQFHFGPLMLEESANCENDYVEIIGEDEQRLAIYCNHTRPPPFVTPGSEVTVHFHSDSAGQDAGFQIHYSIVEGVPGCGGVFTSPSGTITSPGHSGKYESNMDCEWRIQLPVGERIKLTWTNFELEDSTSCHFDYVEVYDGPDSNSLLIGRYCGDDLPPSIKSTSNSLFINFKSDWSYQMEGFIATYEVLCGGEFVEESGVLTSPMYPNAYHKSRTCIYEIIQPPTRSIALTMLDMDIEGSLSYECIFDYLTIYDGDSENSTEIAKLCGERLESTDPYYSTHNFMYLKFVTDSSISGRGFKANYTTFTRRCGGLHKEATGMIKSPDDGGTYGNNEECIWTIQAPPGYVVQLTWSSFELEDSPRCRSDYVSVYENYSSPETELLPPFCGSNTPPTLTSTGRTMTILFRSDLSLTMGGFVATYVFLDASKVCGGHFSKLNGVIRSPNYPNSYPNRKECIWVIKAPNRQRVTLTVDNFNLENHSSCAFDYLEIRNGGYSSSPLIGKYCGNTIPSTIMSQSNQLYVKFVADSSRSSEGFSIDWDSTSEGCGGIMTSVRGEIISPNYPEPYGQSADCTWRITVASGSVVELLITDLDLESQERCLLDFIEIYEGIIRRSDATRYCNQNHPRIIQTKSNIVTVRFRSDFTIAGRGFHLRYETYCHNKLKGFNGVIESPNFPNTYPHSINCTWIIEVPIGNQINMSFSHFEIESGRDTACQYDYLDVKEGMQDVPSTELGKFCGDEMPPRINSNQHQVFVTFITDSFIAHGGFRLEWTLHGCGGHLTRPSGHFTSPNYPSSYSMNVDCEWLIEVDPMHSVHIDFHEIKTEYRMGCQFDKVELFGGADEHAVKIADLCYSEKPVNYTSPGNKMYVKFHADSSFSGRGFNASYRSVPIRCGGVFTADSGTIISPNYPQVYPPHYDCEWHLIVDKHHVINITFDDFDIEDSRNCTDDYLKIFDGPTDEYELLGTHCRNQLPPSYVSSSNEMLLVMRTDSLVAAKGFKAHYTKACGARIIVKENGFIQPSPYSSRMQSAINCTWILVAENPADHVTLTFTHLDIDNYASWEPCQYNYVQVFEGEGAEGPPIGRWCDQKVPSAITSTGNAITVHYNVEFGTVARFTVSYSALNSACGGDYTSEKGIIASPGYPNSYPPNSECVWTLNVSPGNRIEFNFEEFDLQQSDHCDLDYVEIRENSGSGKLLQVACGQEFQPVSASTKLWIKFKSDEEGTAKGFKAEYTFLGGNELSGPYGEITSPMYPIPYSTFKTLEWRITVEVGTVIRIDFKDISMKSSSNFCMYPLTIYDGYNEDAPELGNFCDLADIRPVTSSSNIVFIKMSNDYNMDGNFFDLTWLQVPKEISGKDKSVQLSECNEEIMITDTNSTYMFHSPGWPTGYGHNLDCNWVFTSPPGTHLVVRILQMDLEESQNCIADYVEVYSGNALTSTKDAVLEERLCLANSTHTVKASNVMTVKFKTDVYVNKTGFNAYVYRECGGQLEGPNGVIEMNGTNVVRGVNTWLFSCEWVVEVKPGRTIKVEITDMNIHQDGSTCSNNYLMLKNGGEVTSPLLGTGKYCGDTNPDTLETIGNRLYVKAYGGVHQVRFKLAYREIGANCGGEFRLSKEQAEWEITTPNYPNMPPIHSECFWKVMAPSGERISIHFVGRFDLTYSATCDREYVEIRDGGTEVSKSMGRFCKDTAPSTMTTTGNMMLIHYYTDVPEPMDGFKAVVSTGNVCGGILRGSSGVISSPNYPNGYPKEQTCGWLIVGPKDHTLKIQFRDLHLPSFRRCPRTDHVSIDAKIPGNDTMIPIGTYCGTRKPDVIETVGNEAFITFQSDRRDFVTYRGFSLNYTASQEKCGGEITTMSGIITSPGYPNPRSRYRFCDWRIKVPTGYQVVVDILDLDTTATTTRTAYSLAFYNDFRFKSKIKSRGQIVADEQIKSSSNTMMIGYWSAVGHRGFKLRYTAVAPAPCGATISEVNGTITGPTTRPFNESTYYCQWVLTAPEELRTSNNSGLTLSIRVTGYVGKENQLSRRHCTYPHYISVTDIGMVCGNLTEPKYIRSPKHSNEITIMNGTYASTLLNYRVEYQWQTCGGILPGPRHSVESPKNISYPINCVWHVQYPDDGETIKLSFERINLGNCLTSYIIIRNGGPLAPEIGRFCGNLKPDNITSTSNQLWIEYFASAGPNDFKFNLQPASMGCGGAGKEFASPGFPKQYPNNAECTWELMAENGYHVGLSFIDRFNLETSQNCEKDYLEIFDWIPNPQTGGGLWQVIGKVCGRNTPQPFNSTTNRMKVTFHSNEAVQGDGFHAIWSENCGGVYEVTDEENLIHSPSYPNFYQANLNCNYTLVSPGNDIIVEFLDFQLERGMSDAVECRFDNVTITTHASMSLSTENIYCGENKPPMQRSLGVMNIIFQTDEYVQSNGFRFKYHLSRCGAVITEPTDIQPLMSEGTYLTQLNCTWIVQAPSDKSVVMRFEKFILEHNRNCYFDYVLVYEGDSEEHGTRLAKLCGNLTEHLPVFRTKGNKMFIRLITDSSGNYEGFSAKILFTKNEAAGCGGTVNLTSAQSAQFRSQKYGMYESFEDCHWLVETTVGKLIKFTITSMSVQEKVNGTCNDYIQIRDGAGMYADLLGQYCGNDIPPPIISSSPHLWIRFVSDGTTEGNGVTGNLETIDSPCGVKTHSANSTAKILTSPGYPHPHEFGFTCRWIIQYEEERYVRRLLLHFLDFDLEDNGKCEEEYLEIFDYQQRRYIDEGFGENYIFSGTRTYPIGVITGSRYPYTSYKYCGSVVPHDFYSWSSEVEIVYKTSSTTHKGFKLQYSSNEGNCNTNFTAEQGRIFHEGFLDCQYTITVPENRTISLYFSSVTMYDVDKHCTNMGLQVHDSNSNLLATICGTSTPNPIFSTGNTLTLHSWSLNGNSYEHYDITYTSTTEGRGCGGKIFNYGGTFTSPLYPDIYRNDTLCVWDVSVPRGSRVILQFEAFDLGSGNNCDQNNLKIYDVYGDDEASSYRALYCGGDDPARVESDSDRVFVKYKSSMNNQGTGWIIVFMAQSTKRPVSLRN